MEQAGIVTHNRLTPSQLTHRVPGPSGPTRLPSTIIPGYLPLHVDSHSPTGVHTEPYGDPGTESAHAESVSAASTKPSKKRKDMLRKRDQRADDRNHFAKICALLDIQLNPKNTLARRSECLCINLFMSLDVLCIYSQF